jgi:hypothetical protein
MNFDTYKNTLTYPSRNFGSTMLQIEISTASRQAYVAESRRLEAQFKADLEKGFDVVGNPKTDECFKLAWEYGHSAGFKEVYSYYCDLVLLIK